MNKRLLNLNTIQKITLILTTLLLLPTFAWTQNTYTYGSGIELRLSGDQYNSGNNDYRWNISMTGDNPISTSDGFSGFDELRLTFTELLKGELENISLSSNVGNSSNVSINVYKLREQESGTRTQVGTIEISTGETVTYNYNASSSEASLFDNEYIQIVFEKKDPNNTTNISANAIEGIELEFNGKNFWHKSRWHKSNEQQSK